MKMGERTNKSTCLQYPAVFNPGRLRPLEKASTKPCMLLGMDPAGNRQPPGITIGQCVLPTAKPVSTGSYLMISASERNEEGAVRLLM